MAIAIAQHEGNAVTGGTQVQVALDTSVGNGSLIAVVASYTSGGYTGNFLTAATVGDSQAAGDSYTEILGLGSGEGAQLASWYRYTTGTGILTVTVTLPQTGDSWIDVYEITGAAAASPVDDSDADLTEFITAGNPVPCNAITTTGPAVILGAVNGYGYGSAVTFTPSAGWSQGYAVAAGTGINVEYRTETTATNYTATWTANQTYLFQTLCVAFKEAASSVTVSVADTITIVTPF